MASKTSAIAKTVLFTVFVPGTVAGYVPWWIRDSAKVAVHGIEAWAAVAVLVAGAAIYFHTAFLGICGDRAWDAGADRSTENLGGGRAASVRSESDVRWSGARHPRASVAVPVFRHRYLSLLRAGDGPPFCCVLRGAGS
jgi:hypothetical protein